MALNPKFAGMKLGPTETRHTLELYLDYVCPFSALLFGTFYKDVLPSLPENISSCLTVIFRPQIQPWHPSSTLVHEAALAVLKLAPEKFWHFSSVLFEHQKEYFDLSVVNETRGMTYKRLAKLASEEAGVDDKAMRDLLYVGYERVGADKNLNIGNGVTEDVKAITRANRVVGVHVTPTVFFNSWCKGIVEMIIDSKFTKEQWIEWLEEKVV
ncbi:conserved hypothetical protein [Microsporum canis CBS 113480]|uniref:Uncharacterized protein n=1 Tax=Arthroderma otae (strain ATCC MYA-4605 / CBS 113480) TaxID=554155 RepID=C5FXA7_ARTOC|nr:conserved hypothetical protein [Microsporum canis CBS 113480]EEQ34947.1 conserved hypothetical protein [Microsporum canis CBS 113480]